MRNPICPDCGEEMVLDSFEDASPFEEWICPNCDDYDFMPDDDYLAQFPEDADLYGGIVTND